MQYACLIFQRSCEQLIQNMEAIIMLALFFLATVKVVSRCLLRYFYDFILHMKIQISLWDMVSFDLVRFDFAYLSTHTILSLAMLASAQFAERCASVVIMFLFQTVQVFLWMNELVVFIILILSSCVIICIKYFKLITHLQNSDPCLKMLQLETQLLCCSFFTLRLTISLTCYCSSFFSPYLHLLINVSFCHNITPLLHPTFLCLSHQGVWGVQVVPYLMRKRGQSQPRIDRLHARAIQHYRITQGGCDVLQRHNWEI